MSNTALVSLTLATLVTMYNDAVDAYGAPQGMGTVTGFKSKSAAIERIEKLCEHGNLAVMFDNDSAVIVDATPAPTVEELDQQRGEDEFAAIDGEREDADGEDADGEGEVPAPTVTLGDAKGAVAPSGFIRASDVWLKSNARGTAEREAYRKARRLAARTARKAAKAARESAS